MIALDTNVLIYACDRADPGRQQVALDLIARTTDGVLLWQVACEFIAASRKLAGQGLTPQHAWERLGEFAAIFPLVLPTPETLERARTLHAEQNWSFWDAMVMAACVDCGVKRLYSEDLPGHHPPPEVEIINPFR
jgi:predicted nucleic acid-binding protein